MTCQAGERKSEEGGSVARVFSAPLDRKTARVWRGVALTQTDGDGAVNFSYAVPRWSGNSRLGRSLSSSAFWASKEVGFKLWILNACTEMNEWLLLSVAVAVHKVSVLNHMSLKDLSVQQVKARFLLFGWCRRTQLVILWSRRLRIVQRMKIWSIEA